MPKFVYPKPVQAFPQMGVVQPLPPDPSFMDRLSGAENNFNDIINRPNMVSERNAWTPVINEPSEHDRNFAQLGWGFTDPVQGPQLPTQEELAAMEAAANQPQSAAPPPSNTEMDLYEQLRNLRNQQAGNMGPSLQHQRDMAGLVAGQGVGLDISPLTGLVDNWTGSNFSQTYKAPPTAEEKMRQLAGMQGGIDRTQGAIDQNQIEAIKAAIAGEQYRADQQYKDENLQVAWANALKQKDMANLKKDPSQFQFKQASFGRKLKRSSDIMKNIYSKYPNKIKSMKMIYQNQMPYPNAFKDPILRQYAQAFKDFTMAVMREQSGAAINAEEYKDAERIYIPVGGDDESTIRNKFKAQQMDIDDMVNMAGPAWEVLNRKREPQNDGGPSKESKNVSSSGLTAEEAKELEELERQESAGELQ